MTCARCKRTIKDTERSVYSTHERVNYCPPSDWAACDKKFKQWQALTELTRMSQDLPGGYR